MNYTHGIYGGSLENIAPGGGGGRRSRRTGGGVGERTGGHCGGAQRLWGSPAAGDAGDGAAGRSTRAVPSAPHHVWGTAPIPPRPLLTRLRGSARPGGESQQKAAFGGF